MCHDQEEFQPFEVNSVWHSTGTNTWTNIIQHIHKQHIFLAGFDLHNFADDNNTVTAVAETIQDLINSLDVKTCTAIEWMKDNDMIGNPNKFKAIVLTKTDHNTAGIRLEFSGKIILSTKEVDLLRVTTDTHSHITKICHKPSRQLNALKRLGFYSPLDTRKISTNSFIISIFNYCPLVWYFFNSKSTSENRESTVKESQLSAWWLCVRLFDAIKS